MNHFELEVSQLRGYLLKFARLQLRNDTWAEDAVSETLLGALSKPQSFANRSELKTWLVGILKHKVVDAFRHHNREVSGHQPTADDEEDPLEYIAFEPDGHFVKAPAAWENPADFVQRRQFFEVLELCVERLPVTQGRLFLMREWLELPCDEICKELGLTSTNLYVQLHRARLRLRECLEQHWFLKAVKE